MKRIPLTLGKFALVDDEDYGWLSQWKWHALKARNTYYAQRSVPLGNGKYKNLRMHREVVKTPQGLFTDHIDGDGLNNQKANLRFCTLQQNQFNRSPRKNCTSKFKGVSWKKSDKKWVAKINIDKKVTHIGFFTDEVEAAKAYDRMAREVYGEFARLNFPNQKYGVDLSE